MKRDNIHVKKIHLTPEQMRTAITRATENVKSAAKWEDDKTMEKKHEIKSRIHEWGFDLDNANFLIEDPEERRLFNAWWFLGFDLSSGQPVAPRMDNRDIPDKTLYIAAMYQGIHAAHRPEMTRDKANYIILKRENERLRKELGALEKKI